MGQCELNGYVPRVYEEKNYRGQRVFVVRATLCTLGSHAADRRRHDELLKASRIPSELAGCTFENYKPVNADTGTAKNIALSCAENGTSLLLKGPPGVGKTHLAVAVANRVIADGRSALFAPVLNLMDEMHEAVMAFRERAFLDKLRSFDCIVLDDLGTNRSRTPGRAERMYELVNDRYNDRKQLVVTTNARDNEDLKSILGDNGDKIESRLCRMAAFFTIEAPDHRKRKMMPQKAG
jgi:DNA replication protein DnaC